MAATDAPNLHMPTIIGQRPQVAKINQGDAVIATLPSNAGPFPDAANPTATEGDRRGSNRHMTIFRAGKLTHNGRDNLCLVRNISSGGAMAQVFQDVQVGDEIVLDLRLEERIQGSIVWLRAPLVGIGFHKPVDLGEVLRSEISNGQRRRAPRIDVNATGRLQVGEQFHPVAIDNVSQTGTRVCSAVALAAGAEVRLWIDGIGPQPSFVRWTRNGIIGLAFLRSLSIWELTAWVREQPGLRVESALPEA